LSIQTPQGSVATDLKEVADLYEQLFFSIFQNATECDS